jgi:RNA polymerase sigma-70 factor (ECF subfamily)
MPRSDGELMVAFQEGDQDAFATLYDRHGRALVNFFYKMCYDRALAEDLMQDTFLKLLRARGKYRPEASFKTFLYTVAKNLWIDRHRSQKAAPKTVSAELRVQEDGATLGDLLEANAESPVGRLADREAADLVRTALLGIPEAQRIVFVMAEAQGLRYREISDILGIPVGTVKSRMNAAVTQLRGMLGRVLK